MTSLRPTADMVRQAAQWAALLATDEATQGERDACEAWCRENALHRLAMDRMRGFDEQFDGADALDREAIETVLDRRSRSRRRMGGAAFSLILLLGGGWLAAQSLTVRAWFPDYETATGEERTVTLADGSGLTIDTNAALDFRRRSAGRTVSLFRGQVLARVAKDPAHPFVVETRDGTATAYGTAFVVRRDDDATTVTVIESKVRVCLPKAGPRRCADLLPGDRARMQRGTLMRLDRIDPEAAQAWAEGWLAVDDQPVAGVLQELNRYRVRPVQFSESELAGVRVSGSFPLADTDRALDAIAGTTGLQLSSLPDGTLVVGPGK